MRQYEKIRPEDHVVLVRKLKGDPRVADGKIVIPESARMRNNVQWLFVVAVGKKYKGRYKPGDRLIVETFRNLTLEDGDEVGFVKGEEILGVMPAEKTKKIDKSKNGAVAEA